MSDIQEVPTATVGKLIFAVSGKRFEATKIVAVYNSVQGNTYLEGSHPDGGTVSLSIYNDNDFLEWGFPLSGFDHPPDTAFAIYIKDQDQWPAKDGWVSGRADTRSGSTVLTFEFVAAKGAVVQKIEGVLNFEGAGREEDLSFKFNKG